MILFNVPIALLVGAAAEDEDEEQGASTGRRHPLAAVARTKAN